MFWGKKSDVVPGVVAPSERVAQLRALARQGLSPGADPQHVSAQLEAAYRQEADPLIRQEIVRLLAPYQSPAAESALRSAVRDADADVRVAACQVWGQRKGPTAIAVLGEVVRSDTDLDVRQAAVKALGQTRDPSAVAALAPALDDRDPAMQYLAVTALRQTSGRDFGNDVNLWRQYVRGELKEPQQSPSLVSRLLDPWRAN